MRIGAGVVGLLVLLVGATFAGQGLGYIHGSVMTGDIRWFWIGSGMIVVGAAALVLAVRRSRKTG